MITVQVFKKSTGKPVKGAKVSIGTSSWLGGGVTPRQSTDANGEAHFPSTDPCNGEVFIDGRKVYTGRVEGRKILYI